MDQRREGRTGIRQRPPPGRNRPIHDHRDRKLDFHFRHESPSGSTMFGHTNQPTTRPTKGAIFHDLFKAFTID
jgi:hypothetical protein